MLKSIHDKVRTPQTAVARYTTAQYKMSGSATYVILWSFNVSRRHKQLGGKNPQHIENVS